MDEYIITLEHTLISVIVDFLVFFFEMNELATYVLKFWKLYNSLNK